MYVREFSVIGNLGLVAATGSGEENEVIERSNRTLPGQGAHLCQGTGNPWAGQRSVRAWSRDETKPRELSTVGNLGLALPIGSASNPKDGIRGDSRGQGTLCGKSTTPSALRINVNGFKVTLGHRLMRRQYLFAFDF